MSKKILFCATVDYHFAKFHLPYMRWFQEQGWEVHVAANGNTPLPYTDKKFTITIQRLPTSWKNVRAFWQLRKLMKKHAYEIVHCHTPMGGVLARLAARPFRKKGMKVLYTAHGFHFYQGASWPNWFLYYPIEKMLSTWTDCLITINNEDYVLTQKRNFRASTLVHVHGVGVDTSQYKPIQSNFKRFLRKEYGYHEKELLIIYVGEFNTNKNQQFLIRAFGEARKNLPPARLLLAGDGPQQSVCKQLVASLGLQDVVDFLGYRDDVRWLLPMCDIAASTSLREGLPVNILEAMAVGLPVVATRNRGHNELITHQIGGFVLPPTELQLFVDALMKLGRSVRMRQEMGKHNLKIVQQYSLESVKKELVPIYELYMQGTIKEWEKSASNVSTSIS